MSKKETTFTMKTSALFLLLVALGRATGKTVDSSRTEDADTVNNISIGDNKATEASSEEPVSVSITNLHHNEKCTHDGRL